MLGERLSMLRVSRGLTRQRVALCLDVHQTTYGNYELGKREPDIVTIKKLADFFETSIAYIVGETDDPSSPLQSTKGPALEDETNISTSDQLIIAAYNAAPLQIKGIVNKALEDYMGTQSEINGSNREEEEFLDMARQQFRLNKKKEKT